MASDFAGNQNRNVSMNDSQKLMALLLGLLLGWCISAVAPLTAVTADERQQKNARIAFQSGGERSAEIVEKISRQITTLDQRLARIEASVTGKAATR
jgi:hypothetical protein